MSAPSFQELESIFSKGKPEADKLAADVLKKAPKDDDPFMSPDELLASKMVLKVGSIFLVWARQSPKQLKDKKNPWALWIGKCTQAVVPMTRKQKEKYPWAIFKVLGNGTAPSSAELPYPMDGFFDGGETVFNYIGFHCPEVPKPEETETVNTSRMPSLEMASELPDDEDPLPHVVARSPPRSQSEAPSSVNVCSMEYGLDIETGWLEFIQGEPATNEMRYNSWTIWLDRNFGGFGDKLTSDPKDVQAIDFARKQVQDAAKLYMASAGGAASYEKEWCSKVNAYINTLITWYRVKHHGLIATVARQSIKNFKTDPFPEKFELHHKEQMIEIRTRQFLEGGDPSLYHQTRADRRRLAAARLGQPRTPKSEEETPRTPPPRQPKKLPVPPASPTAPNGKNPPAPPPKPSGKGKHESN